VSVLEPKAVRVKTTDGWQDIALVGPPGPAGPAGPSGGVDWQGEWVTGSYDAGAVVNYENGLWIAVEDTSSEPGAAAGPINVTCVGGGWPSGGADCVQIDTVPLPWTGPPFEGDHFYFDVTTAGTIQFWHGSAADSAFYIYGPDLNVIDNGRYTPLTLSLAVGRHYLRVYAIGTDHGGNMTITPGTGVVAPVAGPGGWELMVQGVAP